MANSIGIGSAAGECRDYTGRTIQHAMHFVPPGVDMCKLCICENGHAKVSGANVCRQCKIFTITPFSGLPSSLMHSTTRLQVLSNGLIML